MSLKIDSDQRFFPYHEILIYALHNSKVFFFLGCYFSNQLTNDKQWKCSRFEIQNLNIPVICIHILLK